MAIHNAMQNKTASFQAVIQCSFLPDEPKKVVGYIASPDQIIEMIEIVGLTGYEISIRHDKKRENWSVCLKGVSTDCVNAGLWLYGNGESQHMAFCAVFYKHFELYAQERWQDRISASGGGVS